MAFTFPIGRLGGVRQTLREQRNLLDVLLDSVDVAVLACDADGRLTHANRKCEELIGKDCAAGLLPMQWLEYAQFHTPDGRELSLEEVPLFRALQGESVQGVDVLVGIHGSEALVSTRANPVHDEQGRQLGAVAVFEDVTEQRAKEAKLREELGQLGLAVEIDEAIAANQLLLYAQPIVDLVSGETVLEELLLRVRSADGTVGGPCALLAAAERHGTVTKIDEWAVEQAAQVAAQGRCVSVNVSARTVGTRSFLRVVESALDRHGVEPSLITFELTETAIVSDIVQASRFAERLDALGCNFALDDFGTGYAALTYLKHLPLRYVKIDIEFVRDLLQNTRSRAVVSGIVALTASFGQITIAEGVENEPTLQVLRELGVDLAQGFHLGHPVPID